MPEPKQTYRKLPGRRRGFIFSAGLWTGSDHILSVKGARFQEQYKRFYFRDIQAIVVTKVPRFIVTTPMVALSTLLLIGILIVRLRLPALTDWLWLLLAALTAGWIYVSVAQSCTCRLYTAVSREDLPSLYRTWTASKALAELERRIAEVQGAFTEDWAEAAEARALGPPDAEGAPGTSGQPGAGRSRNWVSDIFLASLFADAVISSILMRSQVQWMANLSVLLTVVQVASAIGIFVEKRRGILRVGMQRLAIVALLFIGGTTYAQIVTDAVDQALAGRRAALAVRARPRSGMVRPIYSGGAALLAIAGFVLSFKPE